MVSGTIAAVVPMEEPTIIRVKGMIATIKMMNGVERVALTIAPRVLFTAWLGRMCSLRVTVRITPKGIPIKVESAVEAKTM